MGKLDELRRTTIGNVDESMGVGRGAVHGVPLAGPRPVPGRMQGLIRSKDAAEIAVDRIGPDPDQPREEFDREALERLAESLKSKGQLQPVRVRWDEGRGLYVLVCGERRWRAARMAGMPTMSCVITEGPTGAGELLALQLVENALREDLRPLEQAKAFRSLMDQNGWSARQVARELAIAHPNVVRALALLDLPDSVQAQVERGTLPPATAYEVSKIADPAEQADLAARAVDEDLSRAEVVQAVRRVTSRPSRGAKGRGTTKGHKITSRSFRTATAKVSVELRKGSGVEAIAAALRDALEIIEAELSAGDQAAA
jgi:ParB family transcriptional regulator, chromosome partitioning protein